MKEGGCLIVIFLLICIESCSSLDYENICKHHFSQGCPVHEGDSWRCAKVLTNCSGDQSNRYHCVLNSTGQSFKVIHTCAPLSKCVEGTIPIYDEKKNAISCKTCPEGYYQPHDTWSDETPECSERHTCEEEGHKIECDMGTGLSNTQDVYCRCDARNSYILTNFEIREKCVEWAYATCYLHPCPDGQERLLNYSCAPLCPQGQKRDDKDVCVSKSLVIQTTSSLNKSVIMSEETTPKTTTITTTPTSTSMPTTRDNNIPTIIASVIAVVIGVLLILGVLFIYKKYWSVKKPDRHRRQSLEDTGTGLELTSIIPDTDADVAAAKKSSKRARTDKGRTFIRQKIYVNADVAQFGNKNKVKKYNFSAEQQKTSDDSSSNGSRHGSDSSLTDSPHLPNSIQGELPVNRNLSSQRNSSEDIELDTQPKQISNGRDSSEIHADMEQTYRKVLSM